MAPQEEVQLRKCITHAGGGLSGENSPQDQKRSPAYAEKCRIPERRASHNDRDSYPAVSCTGAYQCSDLPGNKVTYKKLFGKTVGTAILTGVQTSAGSKYSFSASEIKKAVPSGYWTIKLLGIKVKYGTTGTLTVNVF